MSQFTPKIAMLSALYLVIAIVLLLILDIGLYYFLNVVFDALNWFNHLHWALKLFIFLIGGISIFVFGLDLIGKLTALIGGLIFNKLPQNLFTIIAPFILSIANAIWFIIQLWRIPTHYNFWIVVELIILSVFIWGLSAIVMPAREQLKAY